MYMLHNFVFKKQDLKSTAYKTLVRPQLEYASTAWSPHTPTDIQKIESVQRKAVRWATRDYRYTSSVTSMLNNRNWRPLDQRRVDCRLVMLSQSQPPIISHQNVGSPDKSTLWHTDRYPYSRTLSAFFIPASHPMSSSEVKMYRQKRKKEKNNQNLPRMSS